MRKWTKIVTELESGKTLEQILKLSGFTRKEISRLKFKNPGMMVNGEKCRSTVILDEGQEIMFFLDDESSEADYLHETGREIHETYKLDILYEDEDLIIVSKPSGMSCHPGRAHYHENLGSLVVTYCKEKGEKILIRQIGRLDKDTSGAVVFAKNRNAAARLWEQRKNGIFYKKYYVLVHGNMKEKEGMIAEPMEPVPDEKNRMRTCEEGVQALTKYVVLQQYKIDGEEFSLLKCSLETGRTHQIRVHMASIGHPVAGDRFYGMEDGIKRLCLHAGEVELVQPYTQQKIYVEIPVKGIPFE